MVLAQPSEYLVRLLLEQHIGGEQHRLHSPMQHRHVGGRERGADREEEIEHAPLNFEGLRRGRLRRSARLEQLAHQRLEQLAKRRVGRDRRDRTHGLLKGGSLRRWLF